MMIVISPAKTLDFTNINENLPMSEPRFIKYAKLICEELKNYDVLSLEKLMSISTKLATLNKDRFEHFKGSLEDAKHCLLAFTGDVYKGMDAGSFTEEDIFYANDHLRILSGMYGVLKPLDGINEYRLEMGTRLSIDEYKNLYGYWGNKIENSIYEELIKHNSKILVNLASKEYYTAIEAIEKREDIKVVTPVFKEWRGDQYKIISLRAKRARGLMSRYIIENQIEDIEGIKKFDLEGYGYNEEFSNENEIVFIRE